MAKTNEKNFTNESGCMTKYAYVVKNIFPKFKEVTGVEVGNGDYYEDEKGLIHITPYETFKGRAGWYFDVNDPEHFWFENIDWHSYRKVDFDEIKKVMKMVAEDIENYVIVPMNKVDIENTENALFVETFEACGETRAKMCNDVAYNVIKAYISNGEDVPEMYHGKAEGFLKWRFVDEIGIWCEKNGYFGAEYFNSGECKSLVTDSLPYIYKLAEYYYDAWMNMSEEEDVA